MFDFAMPMPKPWVTSAAVAAVWFYEGLWCKLLGRQSRQLDVVEAVPRFGKAIGRSFLKTLGVVEVCLGIWVISGVSAGLSAIAQTLLLVTLNTCGILWARKLIHDPGGMVVKNTAFLILAWVDAAQKTLV